MVDLDTRKAEGLSMQTGFIFMPILTMAFIGLFAQLLKEKMMKSPW